MTSPAGVIARPLVALVPTSMPKRTVTCRNSATNAGSVCGAWNPGRAVCPAPPPPAAPEPPSAGREPRATPTPERLGRNCGHPEVSSGAGRCGDHGGGWAVDAAIAAVAATQNGNITRRQLLELGVDDGGIAWRVQIGRLHRVFRGVYAVGRRAITPQERAAAAVLACGPGAALSHSSAMALWGYWRHWDRPFAVTVVGDRRTPGIRVHRSTTLRRRDITTQLGIRVTAPARTLLDMSPRLKDKALKRAVNNALNSLWLTEDQLAEALARHPNLRGAKRIAKLIGLPGTPTRSGWRTTSRGSAPTTACRRR